MAKKGLNIPYLIIIIILGGIAGTVIGEILGLVLPQGMFNTIVSGGKDIGITDPFRMDLGIIKFSLAFSLKINLAGIAGLISAFFIYSKLSS